MNVWPFIPQVNIRERLVWLTDIIDTANKEQRVAMRPYPRTEYDMEFFFVPSQVEAARALLESSQLNDLYVPLWNEVQAVGTLALGATSITVDTTIARYLDGQNVYVTGDEGNFEITTISAITPTTLTVGALTYGHTNAHVMPAYPFKIGNGMTFRKTASDVVRASATFKGAQNYEVTPNVPFPSYNGKHVIDTASLIGGTGDTIKRESSEFSNVAGKIELLKKYNYDVETSNLIIEMDTKAEVWSIRQWLYAIRGRQVSFYVPLFTYDFQVNLDIADTDTTIRVNTNKLFPNSYTGHIMVQEKDGTQHYHEVTAVNNIDANNDELQLSAATGYNLTVSNVQLICRMPLMRSNSDRLELPHRIGGVTSLTIPLREVTD